VTYHKKPNLKCLESKQAFPVSTPAFFRKNIGAGLRLFFITQAGMLALRWTIQPNFEAITENACKDSHNSASVRAISRKD
jgi:hypothetical protein